MSSRHKEFIRVKRGNKKLVLQVSKIEWMGPHEAMSKWVTAKTLDSFIELSDLDEVVQT